ncbi:hypothetical protein AB0E01_44225 [Nocardia vinacea]|uniref:hypothetical protein n=1 Tax=Nocardia vinacea TaxID=96468 RepID=UPI0033F56308
MNSTFRSHGRRIANGVAASGLSPAHVPMSAAVVRRIVETLEPYDCDRLYTLGGDTIDHDAKGIARAAANRHIRWVIGEFDHLT